MANQQFGSPSNTNDAASSFGDVASRVQEKASELGQRASEFGQQAVGAIDARRGTAASGLEIAAAGLHANADTLRPNVSQFAHQAADNLGATATYVREHTMRDMFSDLERYVKTHPTQALLGAVVMGFLVGRTIRRD